MIKERTTNPTARTSSILAVDVGVGLKLPPRAYFELSADGFDFDAGALRRVAGSLRWLEREFTAPGDTNSTVQVARRRQKPRECWTAVRPLRAPQMARKLVMFVTDLFEKEVSSAQRLTIRPVERK
jgi:hypothetical protein